MPGQRSKSGDKVMLETSEYNQHLRLLSAAQRLEEEALDVVGRYGGLIQTYGLEAALNGLNKARQPIHDDIGRRYGWDEM